LCDQINQLILLNLLFVSSSFEEGYLIVISIMRLEQLGFHYRYQHSNLIELILFVHLFMAFSSGLVMIEKFLSLVGFSCYHLSLSFNFIGVLIVGHLQNSSRLSWHFPMLRIHPRMISLKFA